MGAAFHAMTELKQTAQVKFVMSQILIRKRECYLLILLLLSQMFVL